MPEGPELCMNSRFVNNVCSGRLFVGKVVKSAVSKCCEVVFVSAAYTVSSESRGKEMALTLQCTLEPSKRLRLLFRFGMSGKFRYSSRDEILKHAHLQFFAVSGGGVLSFVDVRRFGSWHVAPVGWGENRGPDPLFEYQAFRSNVLQNLDDPAFNRPICEALLNQKYFNGIGNYLRAEILYRIGVIPPFTCARKVLEPLCGKEEDSREDLLWYCHELPREVVDLKQSLGKSESAPATEQDYLAFCKWLKCYENPDMNTARDHNRRTIWFKGEAGAMCPKAQQQRRLRKSRHQRAPGGTMYKRESDQQEVKNEPVEAEIKSGEDAENSLVAAVKLESTDSLVEGRPRKRRKVLPKKESVEATDGDRGKKARMRGRRKGAQPTRRSSRIKNAERKTYT